jgi:hypothetical protein
MNNTNNDPRSVIQSASQAASQAASQTVSQAVTQSTEQGKTPDESIGHKPKAIGWRAFYKRHERHGPAAFFVAGFLFDVLTLGRIDDPFTIFSQLVYLSIVSVVWRWELLSSLSSHVEAKVRLGFLARWRDRFWRYHDEIVHFLYGSLLSAYTLFYFKSASLATSFVFMLVLAVLLVANELSRFQRSGPHLRLALLSLCWISYFSYVIPTLFGFVGWVPFTLAVGTGVLVIFALLKWTETGGSSALEVMAFQLRKGRAIALIVALGLTLAYAFRWLPPVPIAALEIGVYHHVEKVPGGFYQVRYVRPWYAIWQSGAQTFAARPGDKVHVFARVFAPGRFRDEIRVRWLKRGGRGWEGTDSIPLSLVGGRDEGFRGFAFKQNYSPGLWRVQLETTEGREISRISFEVIEDLGTDEREWRARLF